MNQRKDDNLGSFKIMNRRTDSDRNSNSLNNSSNAINMKNMNDRRPIRNEKINSTMSDLNLEDLKQNEKLRTERLELMKLNQWKNSFLGDLGHSKRSKNEFSKERECLNKFKINIK